MGLIADEQSALAHVPKTAEEARTLSELDVAWMGLIADEQSALAHVPKTAEEARTWVVPRSAGKKQAP